MDVTIIMFYKTKLQSVRFIIIGKWIISEKLCMRLVKSFSSFRNLKTLCSNETTFFCLGTINLKIAFLIFNLYLQYLTVDK